MTVAVRLWTGALVALAACRPMPAREATCEPAPGPLPADAQAATLAGDYRLRLIRTTGDPAEVVGTVSLQPTADSLRHALPMSGRVDSSVVHALHGTAEIDLAGVGAVTAGDTRSAEPDRPGVLVVQWPAPPSGTQIVVRLGSEGNRRGSTAIDAAYTVLRVGRIDTAGFAGTWESGSEGRVVSGHFCATRRAG